MRAVWQGALRVDPLVNGCQGETVGRVVLTHDSERREVMVGDNAPALGGDKSIISITGDCTIELVKLQDGLVNSIVTSPPYYGLRDYGLPKTDWPEISYSPMAGLPALTIPAQSCCLGLEETPEAFIGHIVYVFRLVHRVLRDDGTVWLNIGDSYASNAVGYGFSGGSYESERPGWCGERVRRDLPAGLPAKNLLMIPARLALALQADGWYLRSSISWVKGNPMPESVTDRPTKATEKIYLLSKSPRYYYDQQSTREVANILNGFYACNKEIVVSEFSASRGFAAEGSYIAAIHQLAPYLVLALFLASQVVSIEKRDGNLSQILDAFKSPMTDWVGILDRLILPQITADILLNVFENLRVINSQHDLHTKPEFWVLFSSILADSIVSVKTSLTIKEASKPVSKLISNIKILRNTFPIDSLLKGGINIDVIDKSISLFDSSDLLACFGGNVPVTETSLKHLNFWLANIFGYLRFGTIAHDKFSFIQDNYTTSKPNERNLWNW